MTNVRLCHTLEFYVAQLLVELLEMKSALFLK